MPVAAALLRPALGNTLTLTWSRQCLHLSGKTLATHSKPHNNNPQQKKMHK